MLMGGNNAVLRRRTLQRKKERNNIRKAMKALEAELFGGAK